MISHSLQLSLARSLARYQLRCSLRKWLISNNSCYESALTVRHRPASKLPACCCANFHLPECVLLIAIEYNEQKSDNEVEPLAVG